MFYGFGTRNRDWQMSDGQVLLLQYRFVSVMFVFQLAFGKKWHLLGRDRAMDRQLTRSEVEQRYGSQAPDLGLWSQWGLALAIGAFIAVMVVTALLG